MTEIYTGLRYVNADVETGSYRNRGGYKWTVGGEYLNYVDVDIKVALQCSSTHTHHLYLLNRLAAASVYTPYKLDSGRFDSENIFPGDQIRAAHIGKQQKQRRTKKSK